MRLELQVHEILHAYNIVDRLTVPSSGQATTSFRLRHFRLFACHSGAAFGKDRVFALRLGSGAVTSP